MSTSLKALFVSMEDDALFDTELVVSPDDTVEQEIAETAESYAEAEQGSDDVAELGDISEGLESICASMEACMEDGGLNPQAALFMQHAVNGYTRRLGLSVSSITPSLESFGGASGQAAATTISMEGIKETVKKIWQAIKNAVMKAIAAVKNFFAKLIGGAKKLKSRVDALQSKLKSEGHDIKGGKVKVPSPDILNYQGKSDLASINKGFSLLLPMIEDSWSEMVNGAEKYYQHWGALLTDPKTQNALEESAINAEIEKADGEFAVVAAKLTARTKEALGGYYFTGSQEQGPAGEDKTNRTVTLGRKKHSVNEGVEADVGGSVPLKEMLDYCDRIVATLIAKGQYLTKLESARDKALAQTETFVKAAETGKLGKAWSQAKVNSGMRKATKDLTRPLLQVNNAGFSAVRAALTLVERALSSKGTDDKKKDDKKDAKK
jgi:hypothetical protein